MLASGAVRLWVSRAAPAVLVTAVAVSLASSSAVASDGTLGATLSRWSRTIAADARSISLAAKQRHPRQMTSSAVRFRRDALRAQAAIAAQRASSPKGRRGKGAALRACSNYALAGSRWAASGRARVQGRKSAATVLAQRAETYAKRGNRLLIMAGKLLP